MEGESGVTRSIIDEVNPWDIQRDQIEDESGVTRSIINELPSSDIQLDQMEDESGVTQSIHDELHSLDTQGDQIEGERMVLLVVSSRNLSPILGMSKEIKRKLKVVLLEVSFMSFFFGYPTRSKGR